MTNGNSNGQNRNGTANGLVHVNGVNGNGAPHDPAIIEGSELLWDGLSPAVTNALSQPIDPALVSQRKGRGGRTFDYLEGHMVIDQANRIFGHGGWGYELVGDVTLRRIETVNPTTGEVTVSHAYNAPVRVTVAGALPRTDIGVHPVTEETADGHDTAIKGAVTDGMKRAFRSFGSQFGNDFYGGLATGSGETRQPQPADAMSNPRGKGPGDGFDRAHLASLRVGLINLGAEQGFSPEQVKTAVKERTGKELDELTIEELDPLVESAVRKLKEKEQAQAA